MPRTDAGALIKRLRNAGGCAHRERGDAAGGAEGEAMLSGGGVECCAAADPAGTKTPASTAPVTWL